MAFNIVLYKTNKRVNSTYNPGATDQPSTARGTLRADSSIINPVVVFGSDSGSSPSMSFYNYAYIETLARRYFINDWVALGNGLWEAHMSVDVLGSWKTYIGDADLFVLRSSYESDGNVTDMLYPAKAQSQISNVYEDNFPFAQTMSSGRYVVGVGGSDGSFGSVQYYFMTHSQFSAFNAALWASDATWTNIEDFSEELARAIVNPFDYITTCMWLPYEPPSAGSVTSIKVGYWDIPCTALILSFNTAYEISGTIPLTKHPQAATRGAYLNNAPYTRYTFELAPFGAVPLDASRFYDAENLKYFVRVDNITGEGLLYVGTGTGANNQYLAGAAQIGVPVMLASYTANPIATVAAGIGAGIADMANTFGLGANAAAIGNALQSTMHQVKISGTNGNTSCYKQPAMLKQQFFLVTDEDNAHRGRPLMANRNPKDIPGYIMAADGDIEAPATAGELQQIKGYIEGGFFYE